MHAYNHNNTWEEYKKSPGYLVGLRATWATLDSVKREKEEEKRKKERGGAVGGGGEQARKITFSREVSKIPDKNITPKRRSRLKSCANKLECMAFPLTFSVLYSNSRQQGLDLSQSLPPTPAHAAPQIQYLASENTGLGHGPRPREPRLATEESPLGAVGKVVLQLSNPSSPVLLQVRFEKSASSCSTSNTSQPHKKMDFTT